MSTYAVTCLKSTAGVARLGKVRSGLAWQGRYGEAWLGLAWQGRARQESQKFQSTEKQKGRKNYGYKEKHRGY